MFWLKIVLGNTRKIIPISTQKYKDVGVMDLSVSDITLKIISHKKLITTAQVNDFVVTFVVKLCGVNTKNHFKINNCL